MSISCDDPSRSARHSNEHDRGLALYCLVHAGVLYDSLQPNQALIFVPQALNLLE